jgi:hypothetical protein
MKFFRLRRFLLDIRAGKCSGFPNCCIVFYSTAWKLMFGDQRQSLYEKPKWRSDMILWYHEKAGHSGYVPCPLCIMSGARVRVNLCTEECGHVEESQALILEEDPDAKFVRDR